MALTIRRVGSFASGNRRMVIADVTFPATYTTGGEALGLSELKLIRIDSVDPQYVAGPIFPSYNYSTSKLQLSTDNTGIREVANGTSITVTVRVVAIGNGKGNL